MKKIILFTVIIIAHYSNTQKVGIGTTTPNASAALEINAANKGFFPPRVALTGNYDVTTIPAPAISLLVYNTATAGAGSTLVTLGYYFYNGSSWTTLKGADGINWSTKASSAKYRPYSFYKHCTCFLPTCS